MYFFEDFGRFQTGIDKMKEALAQARRWAPTLKPILILGEPGTGRKEMALEIISLSSRSQDRVLRWTSDSDLRLESRQGTVVVENLENFSKPQQEILLRHIGSSLGDRSLESPRWIVTGCRDLLSWVRRGEVLPSLYQVLSEQGMILPSLAERQKDIEPIAQGYIASLNEIFGTQKKISASSLIRLKTLKYERNWNELFSTLEKAYTSSLGLFIDLKDFGIPELEISTEQTQVGLTLSEMERRLIVQTLEMTQQNRTKAAEILGISIRTLRNKLNEYRDQEGA